MTNDERIITLLTEIRDNQKEILEFNRQYMEKALRGQSSAIRMQRVGLGVVFFTIIVVVILLFVLSGFF